MDDDEDEDRFTRAINDTLQAQAGADEYKPVTVDAETLRSLYRAEVFCCAPRQPGLRATYYKSAIPDVHIGVEINQCVGCTRQFFTKSFSRRRRGRPGSVERRGTGIAERAIKF